MHKVLALLLALLASPALAQAPQLSAGQVMGNSTAAQRQARAENVTAILDRAFGSTRGAILERGASGWALIGPGTVGRPFVTGGAGADPSYAVLGIVGGGTNCSAASGACLDNITGFASTGVVARTGAGTYAFRTITGTANQISITNGDGVAGNPTASIPSNAALPGAPTTTTATAGDNSTKIATTAYVDSAANFPLGRTITTGSSIATGDCQTTVLAGTGATGLFTVTLPVVAGFPTGCRVRIVNGDTGRGKSLSGFPSDVHPVLWPLQATVVGIVSGAWATLENPGLYLAPSALTLNVNHSTGSDASTNDCLGTGSGACATIFHAFQLYQTQIRLRLGINPTIQSDCGFTETPSSAFLGPVIAGTGVLFVVGNEGSPSSCVWTSGGIVVDDGMVMSLRGFTARTTGGGANFYNVDKLGIGIFTNMIWGTAASGSNIFVAHGGILVWEAGGTYQVGEAACAPGCFNSHINNAGGSVIITNASPAISLPSALTFTTFYQGRQSGSLAEFVGATFSGAGSAGGSTGTKFNMSQGATLSLFGATLPGATAGVGASGACVDAVCYTSINTVLGIGTGSVSGAVPQNATSFLGMPGGWSATEANFQSPVSVGFTASNLRVAVTSTPAAGQTYIMTLRKNTADTTITCTISNPTTSCFDTTHTATFAAGDLISLKVVASATSGNVNAVNTSITALVTTP